MTTERTGGTKKVLGMTTQHVVMTTKHEEVTKQVKDQTTKTLFQNKTSRFSRYQEMPMSTAKTAPSPEREK